MADLILQGEELPALLKRLLQTAKQGKPLSHWPTTLRTLLHVAGGWFFFAKDDEAIPVLDTVRSLLLANCLQAMEQTRLACSYLATLGLAPGEIALLRIEEVFRQLGNVQDTFTTNTHYQHSRLDVVEAVVLAVVSDDFATGGEVRRWLDDDEYLVRRRIHRDMHAMMGQAGM